MSAGNKSADEAVSDALLEKLRIQAAKPQEAGDALRAIAVKIHARVTSSGTLTLRISRDTVYNSGCLETNSPVLRQFASFSFLHCWHLT